MARLPLLSAIYVSLRFCSLYSALLGRRLISALLMKKLGLRLLSDSPGHILNE